LVEELGVSLRYPTLRDGLRDVFATEPAAARSVEP
jgi:hypothetical protein